MDNNDVNDFLEHFGVKGMRWGVRNDSQNGTNRKTNKEARKDAEEHARAKMFYGQGAGTRRKLINASVAAKKAKDPKYAKAFDDHFKNQDLSVHASKARGERKSTDRKENTKKRAGYLARRLTGEMGTQAAFTAAALAGVAFVRSPKGRALINQTAIKFRESKAQKEGAKFLNDYIKRNNSVY